MSVNPSDERSLYVMHFVYLLRSIGYPAQHYIGLTENPRRRLGEHNSGKSAHTAKYRPWEMVALFGFRERSRASEFERYLKSGSGRAFSNRRLWWVSTICDRYQASVVEILKRAGSATGYGRGQVQDLPLRSIGGFSAGGEPTGCPETDPNKHQHYRHLDQHPHNRCKSGS